jgi:hypothetical protein
VERHASPLLLHACMRHLGAPGMLDCVRHLLRSGNAHALFDSEGLSFLAVRPSSLPPAPFSVLLNRRCLGQVPHSHKEQSCQEYQV